MSKISTYFLNGLIVIAPIGITVMVVLSIIGFADKLLGNFLPWDFPGVGLFFALLSIIIVGWLSTHWFTKKMLEIGERILNSIPLVKTIYSSIKQVSNAVLDTQKLMRQAVLVPYPSPSSKALGFVMGTVEGSMAEPFEEEQVCVFIPMSLNMTSGVNIIVPKTDVIRINVTPESAFQYILTAGSIMPKDNHQPNPPRE